MPQATWESSAQIPFRSPSSQTQDSELEGAQEDHEVQLLVNGPHRAWTLNLGIISTLLWPTEPISGYWCAWERRSTAKMTLSLSTQLNYAAEAGKSVKGERGVTTIQFSLGWYSCNSNFYWYQLLELMLKKHVYYLHIGLQNQGTHISVKQMQGQFPTSWISAQSPCQILNYSLSSLWSESDSYQD